MLTKEGRLATHKLLTVQITINQLKVCLAKTIDATPDADLTYADIGSHMVECDFSGYAEIVNPAWDVPVINGSNQAEGKSSLLTWTAGMGLGSPQTIVAVFITLLDHTPANSLIWLKRISPSVTLGSPGEVYQAYIDLFADDIAALD